jgi:osmoprotectant transport system permease protein
VGGDFEIFSRPEWRAVTQAYGLSFKVKRQYQPDFLYHAVADGDVDVITAFSSDGRIARYGLTLLSDTKSALPPYDAVMLLGPHRRADPDIRRALNPLIGAIPLGRMQQANLMVDRASDKKTPAQAAAWLGALIP